MKIFYKTFLSLLLTFTLFVFASTSKKTEANTEELFINEEISSETVNSDEIEIPQTKATVSLLFAGDIMAHNVNYNMSDYSKIWKDVKEFIEPADLAFANLEAPVDTTKPASNYPNFNMPQSYVEAAIDAGFDVFSLCNNHTNDQGLKGIQETQKTTQVLVQRSQDRDENIYFSGLKNTPEDSYSYNFIQQNDFDILFLPITEILNAPSYSTYINYLSPTQSERKKFIEYVTELRKNNPCDLFIVSVHANEVEYTRKITTTQNKFYMDLLAAGVDVIWANHAHIIKDRKYIFDTHNDSQKVIMYANGNTISGQRTKPELTSNNPIGERDNTGDGLMVNLTFEKDLDTGKIKLINSTNIFITTYINTAYEYVIKPLNTDFIDYLVSVDRKNWASYIKHRIDINDEYTKDLILWQ